MSIFGSRDEDWEQEYDRRLDDPSVKKDKMNNGLNPFRPSEIRVADDEGTMRRRNGEGCCGCGKWDSETFKDKPVWDHHHHDDDEDDDKDDGPQLFWGIF